MVKCGAMKNIASNSLSIRVELTKETLKSKQKGYAYDDGEVDDPDPFDG